MRGARGSLSLATRASATVLIYWIALHAIRPASVGGGGGSVLSARSAPCRSDAGLAAAEDAARAAWERIAPEPDPLAMERCVAGLPDALAEAASNAPGWGALSLYVGELAADGLGGFPRVSDPSGGDPASPLLVSWGDPLGAGPEGPLEPDDFLPLDWSSLSSRWGSGRGARGSRAAAARFAEALGGRRVPLHEARRRVSDAAARAFPRPEDAEGCALMIEGADPSRRERRFAESIAANLGSPASTVARREFSRLRVPEPLRSTLARLRVRVRGDGPDLDGDEGEREPLVPGSIVSLAAARARSAESRPPSPAYGANAFSDRASGTIRVLPGIFFGPGAGAERLRLVLGHEAAHAIDGRACASGAVRCGRAWIDFLARFPDDEAFADWFAVQACGSGARCARAARATWCSEDPLRASAPLARPERLEDAARAFSLGSVL